MAIKKRERQRKQNAKQRQGKQKKWIIWLQLSTKRLLMSIPARQYQETTPKELKLPTQSSWIKWNRTDRMGPNMAIEGASYRKHFINDDTVKRTKQVAQPTDYFFFFFFVSFASFFCFSSSLLSKIIFSHSRKVPAKHRHINAQSI